MHINLFSRMRGHGHRTVDQEEFSMHPVSQLEAYLWATPNARRVSILFEELGLGYTVHGINIRARQQFSPEILALNPYGKIPVVTWVEDGERRTMFESGAILLAFGSHDSSLLPPCGSGRDLVLTWFMVAMTSIGPMTGNAHHWTALAPDRPAAATAHHVALVERAYALLEQRLADHDYLAADYSIADIAAYPWIAVHDWANIELGEYPAIERWFGRVGARPAVARGMQVPRGAKLE